MFKMTDLRLGMKVLVFELSTKTYHISTITELSLNDNKIIVSYNNKTERLYLWEYKKSLHKCMCGKVWCFLDSVKYIKHVKSKLFPQTEQKQKKTFKDYDKYPHDNNTNQIESNLIKQRMFITKVLEQGFVWYVDYLDKKRVWIKYRNPQIEFRNNNYFLRTGSGFTCVKKEGKTLSLTKPENN